MKLNPEGMEVVDLKRQSRHIPEHKYIETCFKYFYCNNNPLRYIDPTELKTDVGDGLLYNEDTEEFFYDDGRDVKEETRVEVQRDSFQDDSNDILIVNVGENVIAEYDGVQSEKNYQSTDENDRHAPDLSDPAYSNVTLPESDDYKLTLLADSESSYENALAVTSKTVQILGLDTVGVEEKYKFLIHSMSKKKKKYIRVMGVKS